MEAGAPSRPPAGVSVQAVVAGRRTEGDNPLAPGNWCVRRPFTSISVGAAFFFSRSRQNETPELPDAELSLGASPQGAEPGL